MSEQQTGIWIFQDVKFLISVSVGGGLLFLILLPILVCFCRKRCAQRKVRKFQSQSSRTSQKSNELESKQPPYKFLHYEDTNDEEMNFIGIPEENFKNDRRVLKKAENNYIQKRPKVNSQLNSRKRPVSADFASSVSQTILQGRPSPQKRHSTIVTGDCHKSSESTNQSQLTILENLTYDDVISTQPVLLHSVSYECKSPRTYANDERLPSTLQNFRHFRQEHQYETITCSSEGRPALEVDKKKKLLRPPSPIQLKRQSKSEDLTIFPSRISRSMHQYEMMSVNGRENREGPNKNEQNNASNSPPVLKMKRKSECKKGPYPLSHSSDDIIKKSLENVKEALPKNTEAFKGLKCDEMTTKPLIEVLNEKNDTVKSKISRNFRVKTGKAKKVKSKGNKSTSIKYSRKLGETQPPIRRRVKRKVKKKRRSRDELRRRLHMRLMGCNSVSRSEGPLGEGVGTGCSYRTDNNNRPSGFAVGVKRKIPNECFSDSTEDDIEILGSSMRRFSSLDSTLERQRKWEEASLREATLLEEIWRHLQAIAERSKMLKDSSSSRRRSNSLTSTDTSTVRRRKNYQKDEDKTILDDLDSDSDKDSYQSDDSLSDKGYYTYSNFKAVKGDLRLAPRSSGKSPLAISKTLTEKSFTKCTKTIPTLNNEFEEHQTKTTESVTIPFKDETSNLSKVYERLEDCCTYSHSTTVASISCQLSENTCKQEVISLLTTSTNYSEPLISSDTCTSTLSPQIRKKYSSDIPLADRNLWKSEICNARFTPPRNILENTNTAWRKRANSEGNYVVVSPSVLLKNRFTFQTKHKTVTSNIQETDKNEPKNLTCKESQVDTFSQSVDGDEVQFQVFMEIKV